MMGWLGFINLYMTRINLSVIIVAMVTYIVSITINANIVLFRYVTIFYSFLIEIKEYCVYDGLKVCFHRSSLFPSLLRIFDSVFIQHPNHVSLFDSSHEYISMMEDLPRSLSR